MIEFKGTISGQTLKLHASRYRNLFVFSSLIVSLLMLLLFGGRYFYRNIILIVDGLGLPLLFLICPSCIWRLLAPNRVYVDLKNRTMVSEINKVGEVFVELDNVVEVKDHGEFYTFKFNFRRNQLRFIAQKDLITQGTIEEFEEVFEEVLVRVN